MGFAIGDVLMEERLTKYNNLTITMGYIPIVFIAAFIMRVAIKTSDSAYDFPTGNDLIWLVLMGAVFAVADYFFIRAYTNGGSLLVVTSIVTLFSVIASHIKFLPTRDIPNVWQLGSHACAAVAVFLVAKGSTT